MVLHSHAFHSRHGDFSIAFLRCWKYLATELNNICCKRYPFTRKKVQSTDRLCHIDSSGIGLSACVSCSGLNLPFCQCYCVISPLISVESLSTGRKGRQTGEAECFSKQPTPSCREATVSRGLRITAVKSA